MNGPLVRLFSGFTLTSFIPYLYFPYWDATAYFVDKNRLLLSSKYALHPRLTTGSPSPLDIWAALYMLALALLRDSSDLHIYKDLYGKITNVSVTYENVAILKKSSYLALAECFSSPVWSLSRFTAILLDLEKPVCSLYFYFPRLGTRTKQSNRSAEGKWS